MSRATIMNYTKNYSHKNMGLIGNYEVRQQAFSTLVNRPTGVFNYIQSSMAYCD
jgi:hypothetical protein